MSIIDLITIIDMIISKKVKNWYAIMYDIPIYISQ